MSAETDRPRRIAALLLADSADPRTAPPARSAA